MDVLYCFITHKSELASDCIAIREMCRYKSITHYIIVYGYDSHTFFDCDNQVLHLNCDDTYEGLPDKIHKLFQFLTSDKTLSQYKFYAKLDRRIDLRKPIDIFLLTGDYGGRIVRVKTNCDGNRTWHIGKCSKNSGWSNKKYEGLFVPWCDGGDGYVLSNYAANIISNNPPNLEEEIYEDQYVAQKLLTHDINPYKIPKLATFFYDKDKIDRL
jgi:hypothetical protein